MTNNRAQNSVYKRILVLLASVLLILATGVCVVGENELSYVPNEVIVTLNPAFGDTNATLANLVNSINGCQVKGQIAKGIYTLVLPGNGTTSTNAPVNIYLQGIRSKSFVSSAQRNYIYHLCAVPNDPLYPAVRDPLDLTTVYGQWAFQPDPDTTSMKHIYAQDAWDIQKGKKDVVVAVIDTGVRVVPLYDTKGNILRYPHPDLGGWIRLPGAASTSAYTLDTSNSRLLRGSYFTGEVNRDESPSNNASDVDYSGHGTHVAGIIAAKTNNQVGVAGLCWNGVWILPLRVFPDGGGGASTDVIARAIYASIDYKNTTAVPGTTLRVDVINMSLGTPSPDPAMETAVKQAVRSGIVVVAAAGNGYGSSPSYPGAFPDCICVSATDVDDLLTDFSSRGSAVDISAPGDYILSTMWDATKVNDTAIGALYSSGSSGGGTGGVPGAPSSVSTEASSTIDYGQWDIWGNGYERERGTSMATPIVSAAVALLRSLDVPAEDVKSLLYQTAIPRGLGKPNDSYGWGLLNVSAALKKACIDVAIQYPSKGSIVPTSRPRIRIDLRHALKSAIDVKIDGRQVFGPSSSNPYYSDVDTYYYPLDTAAGKGYLLFDYPIDSSAADAHGQHTMTVTAQSDITLDTPPTTPLQSSDTTTFKVQTAMLSPGWHLFAVPYKLYNDSTHSAPAPETILGSAGMLARWNYANSTNASKLRTSTSDVPLGEYAIYSLDGSRTDAESTFAPPSILDPDYTIVHSDSLPSSEITSPAGLGYWLYVSNPSGIPVPQTTGESMINGSYRIGLYYGWNMVGNPFAFVVNWSNVTVEYAGERISAADAVARGWISDSIFRYDSLYSRYTWQSVSNAVMYPWEAEWVKVRVISPNAWPEPDITLIVPPNAYTGVVPD